MGHRNKKSALLCSFGLVICFFILLKSMHSILYLTNDDVGMRNFITGSYAGTPDAHLIYIKYIYGVLLMLLYRINADIPWYGLSFLMLHAVLIWIVSYGICLRMKNWKTQVFVCLLLLSMFYIIDIQNLVFLQFTTVAAAMSAGGLFLLMYAHQCNSHRKWVIASSATLFLISYIIRSNVCLIGLSAAFIVLLFLYRREKIIIMIFMLISACGITSINVIENIAYQDEDWQEYQSINTARSELMDFYGVPNYEQHQSFYDSINVTHEDVMLLKQYCFTLSKRITPETIINISSYAKDNSIQVNDPFGTILKAVSKVPSTIAQSHNLFGNFILLLGFGILVVGFYREKQFDKLGMVGCLLMMRLLVWLYLLYMGRLPQRVNDAIYLMDIVMMLGLLCSQPLRIYKGKQKLALSILSFIVLIVICIPVYHTVKMKEVEMKKANNDYQMLIEYTSSNPDNNYFFDVFSVAQYTDGLLSPNEKSFMNYLSFGGWSSYTPLYRQKLQKKHISDLSTDLLKDESFIVYRDGANLSYLTKYYDSLENPKQLVVVDELVCHYTRFYIAQLY